MATKAKSDVRVLKGQDAEDAVLTYVKQMNRPFGAVDVAANLKGAVPKTATQKILVALAEKGELTQKLYGKTTFFVANQAKLEAVSPEKLASLEAEYKTIDDANKLRVNEIRIGSNELAKLKNTPTDADITVQLNEIINATKNTMARLEPLRSGAPIISSEELAQVDGDWIKWRAEWVRRRKIFNEFWTMATDVLPPQDATALAEDLGIEFDTDEHIAVERGPLCALPNLKRKRV
ncbi:hypothetical protein PILCRDRAFT_15021 [Piloderma croceum F 1598]|uniref:Homologous-pairing protein 2 winged helix domain-containing protein n=1 Tax=Piloderma croceum (strain F 1598) TaxID=765440 RepID=A0A0C3B8T9_PILCF|nr:hypothetical protein PILCRDRAFT_15021 [Piloderma croceum F 1598]